MLVHQTAVCTDPTEADRWFYRELLTENYPLVERVLKSVARRHRLSPDEAEELGSVVRLRLVENDYGILRKYEGRSSLATYLTTVISRMQLDCRSARWGRWRPSTRARRLGTTAVQLETLTRRDGLTFTEACEALRTNYGVTEPIEELEALDRSLPNRVRRRMVGEEALYNVPAPEPAPPADPRLDLLAGSLATLRGDDREMVRLVYRENLAIADVARTLRLDARALYRRLDRVRRRLRAALSARPDETGFQARAS